MMLLLKNVFSTFIENFFAKNSENFSFGKITKYNVERVFVEKMISSFQKV